ncbi:hypothetical protein BV898_02810 [Hypsibius exemplaris]|uniref:G-protein coupled receptors family 1 profile domain-containing protein n=1 Tax=Hypsibius exemplaris TaxID=2072580 RepID=A0A1W0X7H2_HYPEX|nr:hypothetical protein BV898_02810 [Hypsibius exemplaris]
MNISNTTTHSAYLPPFPVLSHAKQTELTAWIGTSLTISSLGVFNNLLILRVMWLEKHSKSGLNLLLLHFTAVNVLVCLASFLVPFSFVLVRRNGWPITGAPCQYIHTIATINVFVINWSDAGLAANRVVALYRPHCYKAWTRKPVIVAAIASSWLISMAVTIPFAAAAGGLGIGLSSLGLCFYIMSSSRLGLYLIAMGSYVPYAISGTCALLILLKFCSGARRGNAVSGIGEANRRRTETRRLNVAKMLLLTLLWSGVCVGPGYLTATVFPGLYASNPVSVLWTRTSFACQFAFTPWVLLLSNREYQKRLKSIIWNRPVLQPADSSLRSGRVAPNTTD